MRCISLRNPWASLLIHGFKTWETRSWKPGPNNLRIIQRDGLLIHASATKKDSFRMGIPPFTDYLTRMGPLHYGAIIGQVKVGRIIRTEEWLKTVNSGVTDEYQFGDYSPGRWAWEVLEPVKFEEPIPVKGKLGLWSWTPPNPSYSRLIQKPKMAL